MKRVKRVVAVAFFKEGKLLTCKSIRSSKTNKFTLIGGGIKRFERITKAAIREIKEEISKELEINKKDFKLIKIYKEPAESDPRILVKMHVLISKKEIDVKLIPNKEILEFRWHKLGDSEECVTSSIKEHVIPYAKKHNLMY